LASRATVADTTLLPKINGAKISPDSWFISAGIAVAVDVAMTNGIGVGRVVAVGGTAVGVFVVERVGVTVGDCVADGVRDGVFVVAVGVGDDVGVAVGVATVAVAVGSLVEVAVAICVSVITARTTV
jgi:hypothetical protein